MGKIIFDDYKYSIIFQNREYMLNIDPDLYAKEGVKKYWSDKLENLTFEIQIRRMECGVNKQDMKQEREFDYEIALEKLSEDFKICDDFLKYYKQDGYNYYASNTCIYETIDTEEEQKNSHDYSED